MPKEEFRNPFKRPEGKPKLCIRCGQQKVHPQVRDFCRECFEVVFPLENEKVSA